MTQKLKPRPPEDDPSFQCSSTILELHSDGAKEYKAINSDFRGEAIRKSYSPLYIPELNAITDSGNRTLIEAARALLIQAYLPLAFGHLL